jgi:hypothetical protein
MNIIFKDSLSFTLWTRELLPSLKKLLILTPDPWIPFSTLVRKYKIIAALKSLLKKRRVILWTNLWSKISMTRGTQFSRSLGTQQLLHSHFQPSSKGTLPNKIWRLNLHRLKLNSFIYLLHSKCQDTCSYPTVGMDTFSFEIGDLMTVWSYFQEVLRIVWNTI